MRWWVLITEDRYSKLQLIGEHMDFFIIWTSFSRKLIFCTALLIRIVSANVEGILYCSSVEEDNEVLFGAGLLY